MFGWIKNLFHKLFKKKEYYLLKLPTDVNSKDMDYDDMLINVNFYVFSEFMEKFFDDYDFKDNKILIPKVDHTPFTDNSDYVELLDEFNKPIKISDCMINLFKYWRQDRPDFKSDYDLLMDYFNEYIDIYNSDSEEVPELDSEIRNILKKYWNYEDDFDNIEKIPKILNYLTIKLNQDDQNALIRLIQVSPYLQIPRIDKEVEIEDSTKDNK